MLVRKSDVIIINGLFIPYMCATMWAVVGNITPGIVKQLSVSEWLAADRACGHRHRNVKGVKYKPDADGNGEIFAKRFYSCNKYHHKQADKQG